jgi:hypothetical protein
MTRKQRAQELRQLRQEHPERLIALYRGISGTPELGQLPTGFSFASLIDAIIEHEAAAGKIDQQP